MHEISGRNFKKQFCLLGQKRPLDKQWTEKAIGKKMKYRGFMAFFGISNQNVRDPFGFF